ncbi:MAG: protein transport protein bet1 [Peltula sp. TS41687]|nr:MAG: protein transport protein bet1 [Peltula sp. TS41687]
MTARYAQTSTLHNRDGRTNTLFDAYTGDNDVEIDQRQQQQQRRKNNDPGGGGGGGYGYGYGYGNANGNGSASMIAGGGGMGMGTAAAAGGGGGYRPATPNSRGQYSDAVLSSLESQNDAQIEGLSGKVKMLKDDRNERASEQLLIRPKNQITLAIGDEIRDSTALAEKMNDQFDSTRSRIKGTMNRMLRMAERTGVGWKVWLLFFAAVSGLFLWVWLF